MSEASQLDQILGALADPTRRAILLRLSRGDARVTDLAAPFAISLNSVSKHIRILERARIVRCTHSGRERLYELDPIPVQSLKNYLDALSGQWDAALDRLRSFVESDRPN